MIGKSGRSKLVTKGMILGSISKETENNPGSVVSVYPLHLDHPGLVTKLSGKLTSVCIWSAKVIVDRFSYWNYVHLMKITSQE